jgi:hypothetical protein
MELHRLDIMDIAWLWHGHHVWGLVPLCNQLFLPVQPEFETKPYVKESNQVLISIEFTKRM